MGNIVNHNYESGLIYFKLLQVKCKIDSKKFKQNASTNDLLKLKQSFMHSYMHNMNLPGFIPGLGRSSAEGNGNPLQYYCLKNPMDREAWWATVPGVTKNQT